MRRSTRRSASIWKSRSGITSPPALSRNKRSGARGVRWIGDLFHDLRYAVRTLRRSPAFAAVAVLSLALGIGANTAIFSLIDAVMLRMLPVREPARLLQTTRFLGGPPGILLLPAFRAATRIERTATRTADTSDLRGLLPPPPRRPSWQRPAPSEQPLRGRPRPGSEPIARRTGGRQPGRCRGQPKPSDRRLIAEGYPCRYPAGIGAASAVSTGSLL